jgi:alpha-N-arabinofuranosidase
MCNIAQMVNVLHSLLLTDGDRCIRTSTYYAYELMKRHRGAISVRTETPAEGPLGLSASASRKDGELHLTLVNPAPDRTMTVACAFAGTTVSAAKASILHHADMNAANTFDSPGTIVPSDHTVEAARGALSVTLPALSIVSLTARV